MSQKKKLAKRKALPPKGIKLVKVSALPKVEIAKINFDSIWIMRPSAQMPKRKKLRLCRCRNICIA